MRVLPTSWFTGLRVGTVASALVLTACWLLPAALSQDDPLPDPLPIRRVLLPVDRVTAELEKAKRGALVQLSRADFEEKVKQAALAGEAFKMPPRLVETRYRATLVDNALVGNAEWKVVNPTAAAGLLPVGPIGIALKSASWSDGRPALLGDLDGKEQSLLVETPGTSSLLLDWSLRSTPLLPGGLRFSLEVPPSAIASLELELPADRTVNVARDSYLLSGPHRAAAPDRSLWRIGFAGHRGPVSIEVRRSKGADLPPPVLLSKLQSNQTLKPGQLLADFDFEVEVLHGAVSKLTCEYPTSLRPYEVSVRNLDSWEVKPPAAKGDPATIIMRLREPFEGGPLQIRCLAPLGTEKTWTSPGMRLAGAVSRGETLNLLVAPGVQLDDWQPHAFRTIRTAFEGEKGLALSLTAALDAGPNPVRPTARIQTPGPEYKVRQLSWWQLTNDRSTLTAQINYDMVRGRLFALPVALPAGWEVENVELSPPDLLRHSSMLVDKGKPVLMVDLQRGLEVGASAKLTVRARPDQAIKVGHGGLTLSIPDLVPLGARLREGALAISIASLYQTATSASVVNVPVETIDRPPWGKQAPDYYFPYQGQPVEGTLQLKPRAAEIRARCVSDVVVASGRVLLITRLELHPEVGNPQTIDLFVSGPVPASWEWRTVRGSNHVTRLERIVLLEAAPALGALGATNPLQAASLSVVPQAHGSWWQLTLAHPLTEAVTIETTLRLNDPSPQTDMRLYLAALAGARPNEAMTLGVAGQYLLSHVTRQRHWEVPLVSLPAAERLDGQVTLHLAGTDLVHVDTEGLREVESARHDSKEKTPRGLAGSSSWRTFRYGHPPIGLTLRGQEPATDRSGEAVADRASLTTYLGPDGQLLHRFRVQVWNWRQRQFPVRLPARAQLVAAKSDDRWVAHLPSGETADGTSLYEIPVAFGPAMHTFEILYSTPLPSWFLWAKLDSPEPVLPLKLVGFRRFWCMPQGIVPLNEGSLQRLPGDSEELRDARQSLAFMESGQPPDWALRQELLMGDAAAALRKQHRAGEDWTLGRTLERLAFDDLKDNLTLIVDSRALRVAGLNAQTVFAAESWERVGNPPLRPGTLTVSGPWESIGLVYLACRPAPVLTTRQQLALWQAAAGSGGPVGRAVEDAVAEATAFGHDRSGRFRTVPDWLQLQHFGEPDALARAVGSSLIPQLGADWSEWEPAPTAENVMAITVVRPSSAPTVGLVLAALITLGAVRFGRQTEQRRRRVILAWLALTGLALLWLPPVLRPLAWPATVAAIVVAIVWTLRGIPVAQAPKDPQAPSLSKLGLGVPVGASFVLLISIASVPAEVALPAGSAIVYLIPDPEGKADKQSVLATPALLTQLETLAKRGAAGLRGAALIGANYDGRATGNAVSFTAQFQVHCFSEDPVSLALPISGINLTRALLDGATAYPAPPRGPRDGYLLEVKGRGPHTVELQYTVPLQTNGDERELRYAIPELPRSQLTFCVSDKVSFLHASDVHGAERVKPEDKSLVLQDDLGAAKLLRLRWRRDAAQPTPPDTSVKESYYWQLHSSTARLMAILQYTISKGSETTFQIGLPADLEVLSVEAGAKQGTPGPRLKEWLIKEETDPVLKKDDGITRRLILQFQGPITQGVQVTLELVPRQAFGATANFPFPKPLFVKQVPGFLAYRTEGVDTAVAEHHAIRGIEKQLVAAGFAESFAQPWRQARLEDLPAPTLAFTRSAGGVLHLTLRPPTSQARGVQEIAWRVGPNQAMLKATAKVTSADSNISLVEWEVPAALNVVEVSGPHVRQWTRSGGRLQVWLQKPVAEANLQLTGWLPRNPKTPNRFDLLPVRLLDTKSQTTTVRVGPTEGLLLAPGALQNLAMRLDLGMAGREWVYTTEQDTYGGTFVSSPAAASTELHLLTFAEVRDRELIFVANLDCNVVRGELRTLSVSLRNWDRDVKLEAPDLARKPEQRTTATGRTWTLELKPGVTHHYQMTISGRVPLGAAPELLLPDIRVETPGATSTKMERWLAVAGADLTTEGAAGLAQAGNPADALTHWPGEANRLRRAGGSAWQITADDWRLRIRPRLVAARPATVQLFLTENTVAVADGRHWMHQATYWLYHEAGADLSIALPVDAVLLGVAIDGVSIPPLQPDTDKLWLPLSGGAGLRTVRLNWTFPDGKETLDQPILEGPRLEGVAEAPSVWSVAVPGGYQAGRRSNGGQNQDQAKPASAAGLELARASAHLRLMSWLVERAGADRGFGAQLLAAQDRFERCCRRAEYQLNQPTVALLDSGPAGQSLATWLQELREQFNELTKSPAFERLRNEKKDAGLEPSTDMDAAVSPAPWMLSPVERGRPAYWAAVAGESMPRFRLLSEEADRYRQTTAFSVVLLVLLLVLWILSRLFHSAAWPEQLIVLGGVGWLLIGSPYNLLFLALPAAWLGARLVHVGKWLQQFLARRQVPVAVPGSVLR